jgi:septal ring factor EnvC (AmiA/AmiB activator)
MDLDGWRPDPFGTHEERFFKQDEPTPLVRDSGVGSYDEPPDSLSLAAPSVHVEAPVVETTADQPTTSASPGPGWWLASDGKWYPPAPVQEATPPPPPPPSPPTQVSARSVAEVPPVVPRAPASRHRGFFGGKRELEEEVERLDKIIEGMGIYERDELRAEVAHLQGELPRLKQEEVALLATVEPLRTEVAALDGERAKVQALGVELQQLQQRRDALTAESAELERLASELPKLRSEYGELSQQVVEMRETAILQEVGIYQYRHPLDDAVAYKARLSGLQGQIKDAVKAGNAVLGATTWTVNGSVRDGAKMVREFSKLMLRAYNNEADNSVRSMKPYTLESSVARLVKAKDTITKLGGTMNIRVTDQYHHLRIEELELTADYLAKVAEEKETDREERARLREEEVARREFEREQERLRKEHAHYESTVASLRERGDQEGADKAAAKLSEIADAIDGINRRAANIRAGHIYVISNIGAFGSNMVKIGMTRRLDPMDRVRELGDASVPFHYDVHAIVFSDDAVGLEHHLHEKLAAKRANFVNMRREFFYVHPSDVRDILTHLDASIVTWVEEPEALEWRQSETTRRELARVAPEQEATRSL